MNILHSAQLDAGLFLWAEEPLADESVLKALPSRRRKSDPPPPYPYGADFDVLARAIRSMSLGFRPTRRRLQTAAAWLPSRGKYPYPSSEVIGDAPQSRAKPHVAAYAVEGLLLQPAEAYAVLTAFGERTRARYRMVNGRDFTFWAEALRLAGSLVARQRYLPDIERLERRWYARWHPVWLGNDSDTRDQLAERMPPVARALTSMDDKRASETPARQRLTTFVATMVDQIVRQQGTRQVRDASAGAVPPSKKQEATGNVYDHWLQALRRTDARVPGKAEELETLEKELHHWWEPLDRAANAPFRLCFRLEEPAEPGKSGRGRAGRNNGGDTVSPRQRRWFVRFLLQPNTDPDLLVFTSDAWETRGRKARMLKRMGADLHETLLALLGQAAFLCPDIAESLHSRKPSGFSLDADGAHMFLTVTAPLLSQAGFGVLLPDWWTGHGTRARLCIRARVDTPPRSEAESQSLEETLPFRWEIGLGERTLKRADLETMARLEEPLQNVHGQWVETSREEIVAALDFWENRKADAITVRELVQLGLGRADRSAGIPFDGVVATGWLEALLSWLQNKERIAHIEMPGGFQGELRPYQKRGHDWLDFLRSWDLGACLADDMGLGKTIQTLALIQDEYEFDEQRPVLIVCPTSVLSNWEHEARRFTPELTCYVHHGPGRPHGRRFVQRAMDHAIVLTSYALLQRDLEDLAAVGWAGLVADEAQNIKNRDTKQSRAIRELSADYRIALTGTPVENHVGDLYAIMDFLNPGSLGTPEEFKRTFYLPIQAGRDRAATERLRKITAPFILRRLKTDQAIIADLPEKHEMKVFCTLTREQGRLYQGVVRDTEAQLRDAQGIGRHGLILATLTKLKQVCNHPAHYLGDGSALPGRSGKLARITEMLEEVLVTGERCVLFTQFAQMGTLLQSHLGDHLGVEVLYLHGGTPRRKRDTMVARFQSGDEAPPIFVLSLKAGGTGLNLTAANHVFHFDRWWNPAVENQATDRAFRIGQTKRVQVHKFVCAGTLEERIDAMIMRKRSIAEDIVGTGERWITDLNDEDLHELLALEENAIRY